jgi:putative hydrolase of the HAD superfamily
MIRGIIFDLDNTLTDFMRMKQDAIEAAVEAMIDAGLPLGPDEAAERIFAIYDREGIEYQQVFDEFIADSVGSVDPRILAAGIVGYRRARESKLVLYPHVKITIIELTRRGFRLAVLSDAPSLQAWLRLCQLDLHHHFDPVVTFDDTGVRKPDPKPFRVALERMGLESGEVLMVGDWPERDVVGAKGIGIRTVHARYGDTFGTVDSDADFTIDSIRDLLPIIDALNAEASGRDPELT